MCITFFCLQPKSNPKIKLIIGFNRDESSFRETLPLAAYEQDKNIYAGRDLTSGGTWLGLNILTGVMVILTNYHYKHPRIGRSRGQLVYSYLSSKFIPEEKRSETDDIILKSMEILAKEGFKYSPFNITVVNLRSRTSFYVCSEKEPKQNNPIKLNLGKQYGICNSAIDEIWAKTAFGIIKFRQTLTEKLGELTEQETLQQMQKIMKDKKMFSQNIEDESSIFIEPYESKRRLTERRTKSTLYMIMSEEKQKYQLLLREVIYLGTIGNVQQYAETHRLNMSK